MTDKVQKKKRARLPKRGIMAQFSKFQRSVTLLMLAIACVGLTFTELGFFGIGMSGEHVAYAIVLLVPVALAALLLGMGWGTALGLFAGVVLLLHSSTMPLDFYEFSFVTPLTSVFMLTGVGFLLGLLFALALRNGPSAVRGGVYIAIVCFFVSGLYSAGFFANAFMAALVNLAQGMSPDAQGAELENAVLVRVSITVSRIGDIGLQAFVDFVLMGFFCIVANSLADKVRRSTVETGLRVRFGIALVVVAYSVLMLTAGVSFVSITQAEIVEAANDMRSEVDYLCSQLDHAEQRFDAIFKVLEGKGVDTSSLTAEQQNEILKSVSIDTLLDGYDKETDGTILILIQQVDSDEPKAANPKNDYWVVLSDDDQFELASSVSNSAGDELVKAIDRSAESGQIERIVLDENYGESLESMAKRDDAIRSHIDYLVAGKSGEYIVAIMQPADKVFNNRSVVMNWTTLSVFVLLAAVFGMTFLLLSNMVVRRIEETNNVLARITAGDLDARVDVRDTREFALLSDGVNDTVTALKGWIAEAETRMNAELRAAKAIQAAALPRVFPPYPDIAKLDIYASMNAAREVGGDFYDFFLIGDDSGPDSGKMGFVVADVSGKGVPAALFMMKAKTQIRDYLISGMNVGEAIENANRQLCDGNDSGMFVTAWVGVLDYAAKRVDFVNAGHNPPLYWHDGSWKWLTEKSGLPLGLFDGLPYEAHSLQCEIGDQFLLYTDGVTEAMDVEGDLYGEQRLLDLANENYTSHPRPLVESVRADVASYARGAVQSDDITVLAMEVGVPPEVTAVLVVKAVTDELTRVYRFIHTELDRRLCPLRVQNQLDIAVEELFVNVAHYAYPDATPDKPGMVRISYTYSADPPSITVSIADEGIPYDPLAKPDAVTPEDIMEVPIGGLGIFMAKRSVDEMHYERLDGSNVVTIVKRW